MVEFQSTIHMARNPTLPCLREDRTGLCGIKHGPEDYVYNQYWAFVEPSDGEICCPACALLLLTRKAPYE